MVLMVDQIWLFMVLQDYIQNKNNIYGQGNLERDFTYIDDVILY